MTDQAERHADGQPSQTQARFLRVKVTDEAKQDHPVVNIKVPIGLVRWGLRMGEAFSPELKDADIDWESIKAIAESVEPGMLIEVDDEAEHKRVEVWVE